MDIDGGAPGSIQAPAHADLVTLPFGNDDMDEFLSGGSNIHSLLDSLSNTDNMNHFSPPPTTHHIVLQNHVTMDQIGFPGLSYNQFSSLYHPTTMVQNYMFNGNHNSTAPVFPNNSFPYQTIMTHNGFGDQDSTPISLDHPFTAIQSNGCFHAPVAFNDAHNMFQEPMNRPSNLGPLPTTQSNPQQPRVAKNPQQILDEIRQAQIQQQRVQQRLHQLEESSQAEAQILIDAFAASSEIHNPSPSSSRSPLFSLPEVRG
jgi:hypothetical protein